MLYSKEELENLCLTIKANDIEKVRLILLSNSGILTAATTLAIIDSNPKRRSPLWEAMLGGYEKIVDLLVDFGANPDEPSTFDKKKVSFTFFHWFSVQDNFRQHDKQVAEVLVSRGANLEACSGDPENPKTPLQMAIEKGNMECIEFLLSNGAQFKHTFVRNIRKASKKKQKKILDLLIQYKQLDSKLRDEKSFNYLHLFIIENMRQNSEIDVVEIAKTLLDLGVSVNDLDYRGRSTLFYSIYLDNLDLITVLIDNGANINEFNNITGYTPVQFAAQKNFVNVIELLLSRGGEIDLKSLKREETALHIACFYRNEETIDLLIEKGAHIGLRDHKDRTPFSLLNLYIHSEADVRCINLMVKRIAQRRFFQDPGVCTLDVEEIEAHPVVGELFRSCLNELSQMSNTEFYFFYSYCHVLKMTNKIKKLANLTKNEDFVFKFEESLNLFSYYEKDLRRIWEKAICLRDNSLIVEGRLKSVFGNLFPLVVLRKIADNLTVRDLPLE